MMMRVTGRQVLLASVLSLGVCIGLSSASQASGGRGDSFQPQGSWAISRIASKTDSGKPYCALARRFSDGVILTFARNGSQESSLAIDFQKDVFTRGNSYQVSLDAGDGQDRPFSVKPVSTKAVVLKLGNDPDFFESLAQTKVLKVDIMGQKYYSFDIPDLAEGQKNIGECVTALNGGVDASQTPSPVPSSVAEAVTPMPNETLLPAPTKMTALPQDIIVSKPVSAMVAAKSSNGAADALQEENARLRDALSKERQAYQNITVGQTADNSVVAELSEKIKLLESENGKLNQRVAVSKPVPDSADAARVKEENERLKGALAQTRAQLVDMQKIKQSDKGGDAIEAQAAIDLRQRVAALESENVDLKGKLSAAAVAAIAPAAGDAKADPVEIVQANAKVTTLQTQLDVMKAERDRLATNLDSIKKGEEGERLKLSSDNWNLEEATRRLNEAEREVKRLGTLVQKERGTCTVEKKGLETMLFDPRVADKKQIERLVELEEKANKATAALDAQKAAYEAKIAQIQAKEKDSGAASQATFAEIEKLKKDRDVLMQRLAAAENEKSDLMASLSSIPTAAGEEMPALPPPVPMAANIPMPPEKLAPVESKFNQSVQQEIVASTLPAPMPPVAIVPSATFMQPQDFQAMLQGAGVTLKGAVQKIDGVSSATFAAYSWETAETFGSAEQKPMASLSDFDAMRDQYIAKTKERCTGDFAAIPSTSSNADGARVEAYEIACVGKDAQAAASLLFFTRNGAFTTVAHETPADGMDQAMEARDRLMAQVTTQKMAAK
jgi:hypothetical protein